MRGVMNDFIRWLIGLGFAALGPPLEVIHLMKISVFPWRQGRLRRRFGVTADTPILSYGVGRQHSPAALGRSRPWPRRLAPPLGEPRAVGPACC